MKRMVGEAGGAGAGMSGQVSRFYSLRKKYRARGGGPESHTLLLLLLILLLLLLLPPIHPGTHTYTHI